MTGSEPPLVISAPFPRTLPLIFAPPALATLTSRYRIVETEPESVASLGDSVLQNTRYIIGQPPLSAETVDRMPQLRAIFNVEGNLLDNMPYEVLFRRGVHVLTTSRVFAVPVAELGLALALCLARGIPEADRDFQQAEELWGGEGNRDARLLAGSEIGIIGFGDLGKALQRVLSGFSASISACDPWLPDSVLREHGVRPVDLKTLLTGCDVVFAVASVTTENQGFLGADAFAAMKPGAIFVLLSRAEIVDFDALMAAVAAGHILAASDVFPEEPLSRDHPVRRMKGFLRSAHRAGALDSAFREMGGMLIDDMQLMDRGLPPVRCKRAERETVSRMRSRPVTTN
ncbi:MAG: NAD(P)-dependent oxidoreductase [Paracoccaceae bacterium]